MKPWYKRSETWFTVFGNLVGLWQMAKPANPWANLVGGIVSGSSNLGFGIARGLAKHGTGN